MDLTKKTILYLILFLWVIFSVVYIINDVWSNYKKVQLVNAYNQGKADTINALIQEADKCQPFPVSNGEKEVQLTKIGCPGVSIEQ